MTMIFGFKYGPIDPQRFVPFPKNPTLIKFFIQLGRVEELGSGVLNINRYIEAYSGAGKPEFIEGEVFKVRIPLPDYRKLEGNSGKESEGRVFDIIVTALSDGLNGGVNGGVNDTNGGVNDGVKKEVARLVALIHDNEGINSEQITAAMNKSKRTVERYLKIARRAILINFTGAPKTGGYYLTEELKTKLGA